MHARTVRGDLAKNRLWLDSRQEVLCIQARTRMRTRALVCICPPLALASRS